MAKTYHHGSLKVDAVKAALQFIQDRKEVSFTIREIAQALKVTPMALYRHFSSKKALLEVIAEEGFSKLLETFKEIQSKDTESDKKMWLLGLSYIEFAVQNEGHFRTMFHQELRCHVDAPASLQKKGEDTFSQLVIVLQEGMEKKIFTKRSPETTARTIWASVHGFSNLLIDGQFHDLDTPKKIQNAIGDHLKILAGTFINIPPS